MEPDTVFRYGAIQDTEIRQAVGAAVRTMLENHSSSPVNIEFATDIVQRCLPDGSDPEDWDDADAYTVIAYADEYCDSLWHGFPDLNGYDWDYSATKLLQLVDELEAGLPLSHWYSLDPVPLPGWLMWIINLFQSIGKTLFKKS